MRTLTLIVATFVAGLILAVPQSAQAAIDFEVNVGIGPVRGDSLALYTTQGGNYFFGDPYANDIGTVPYGYSFLTDEVNSFDFIVSDVNGTDTGGFTSWRGSTSASGAFANQQGNRLYLIGTRLVSEDLISLSNVTVTITSAPNPILNLIVDYSGDSYNVGSVVGIQWVNGQGGGDDIGVATGSASQEVNEIMFLLGPGNGVSALTAAGVTDQDKLTNTRQWIERNIETITFEVSYNDGGGIESAEKALTVLQVHPVPEPATALLLVLGIGAILSRRST